MDKELTEMKFYNSNLYFIFFIVYSFIKKNCDKIINFDKLKLFQNLMFVSIH
jgi:hypothetical protein